MRRHTFRNTLAGGATCGVLVAGALVLALARTPQHVRALPPAGTDVLRAGGQVTVESRLGSETINLQGSVTIQRGSPFMDSGVEVEAAEITSMSLNGRSLTGPVSVIESPTLASTGQIRSLQPPPNQFPASSFFDVYARVTAPASPSGSVLLSNSTAFHMTAATNATAWPPGRLRYDSQASSCVPLFPTLPAAVCVVSISISIYVDTDGDGCADEQELGPDEHRGGRRNPLNPYDFYDVNGDRVVTLPGDILAVARAFGRSSGPNYNATLDRRPPPTAAQEPDPTKREPWDMGPPDGFISLPADILGVVRQFGHDCSVLSP